MEKPYKHTNLPWPKAFLFIKYIGGGSKAHCSYAIREKDLHDAYASGETREQKLRYAMDKIVVVKQMKLEAAAHELAPKEVRMMNILRSDSGPHHNRCSRLIEAADDYTWIVMTPIIGVNWCSFLYPEGDRYDIKYSELLMWHSFLQLFEIVYYLHSRETPIVHCDIHDENLLVDTRVSDISGLPNIMLVDFGNSMVCDRETYNEVFRAPICSFLPTLKEWSSSVQFVDIQFAWDMVKLFPVVSRPWQGITEDPQDYYDFEQFVDSWIQNETCVIFPRRGNKLLIQEFFDIFGPIAYAKRAALLEDEREKEEAAAILKDIREAAAFELQTMLSPVFVEHCGPLPPEE